MRLRRPRIRSNAFRDDIERIPLAQLLSPHATVWQLTEPTPDAAKRLTSLNIAPLPPTLSFG